MDEIDRSAQASEGELKAEARALAASWPRELIQAGDAERLAGLWVASRRAARMGGRPAFAHAPLSPALVQALFEARRARRIVRGLEAAEEALASQAAGVRRESDSSVVGAAVRISRLLIVSSDGSERMFKKVSSLQREYGHFLEVLVCTCDELALGGAVFGEGSRARAVMVDHKEAVVRVLRAVEELV